MEGQEEFWPDAAVLAKTAKHVREVGIRKLMQEATREGERNVWVARAEVRMDDNLLATELRAKGFVVVIEKDGITISW